MTWRQINAVGAGLLLAALLLLSPAVAFRVVENGPTTPTWWDLLLIAGFLVCAGGLASSYRGRVDPRLWAVILALITAVGIGTFPLVARAPLSTGEHSWVALLVPVGAAALGVALPVAPAVCAGLALAVVNALAHGSPAWPSLDHVRITEGVYVIICTFAAASGMEALRMQAKAVDTAEQRAILAAARAGQLVAQRYESARWDAFIHDEVLAALEAARGGYASREDLGQLASDALVAVDQSPSTGWFTIEDICRRLSQAVGAHIDLRSVAGSTARVLPGDVLEAIEVAVTEACRNVRRHTPDGTVAQVIMVASGDGLLIEVRDDGGGFDPARVSRTRMGIGVSIVGRMRAVSGDAIVRSLPGRETIVSIRWPSENR